MQLNWPFLRFSGDFLWMQRGIPAMVRSGRNTAIVCWLIDWVIDWLIDWLIDWQMDRLDWLIDWFIDWLIDCLVRDNRFLCYRDWQRSTDTRNLKLVKMMMAMLWKWKWNIAASTLHIKGMTAHCTYSTVSSFTGHICMLVSWINKAL